MDRVAGKTVLVRIDPAAAAAAAAIIRALSSAGARVALVAGYGAPAGDFNPAYTLRGFVPALEAALERKVVFIPESVGSGAEAALARVPEGGVALLENVRFHPDERRRSRAFAMRLSALADFFTVPGGIPETASAWIRELAGLLPEPDLAGSATA